MKSVLRKYSAAIFFYLAILGMIFIINARFEYLDGGDEANYYAYSE